MALGTRAPNEPKQTDVYAELPRDLDTELTAKTVAKLRAVFGLQATTETAPKHQNQERRSQAFNRDREAPHDAPPPTSPGIRITYHGDSVT